MTFGAHKLVRSEPFWTPDAKIHNCYRRYVAKYGKKIHRCTSTFLALKYCGGFLKNLSAIYTKWCAQTFPPIFELFTIFDRNLPKIVASIGLPSRLAHGLTSKISLSHQELSCQISSDMVASRLIDRRSFR